MVYLQLASAVGFPASARKFQDEIAVQQMVYIEHNTAG